MQNFWWKKVSSPKLSAEHWPFYFKWVFCIKTLYMVHDIRRPNIHTPSCEGKRAEKCLEILALKRAWMLVVLVVGVRRFYGILLTNLLGMRAWCLDQPTLILLLLLLASRAAVLLRRQPLHKLLDPVAPLLQLLLTAAPLRQLLTDASCPPSPKIRRRGRCFSKVKRSPRGSGGPTELPQPWRRRWRHYDGLGRVGFGSVGGVSGLKAPGVIKRVLRNFVETKCQEILK